MSARFTNYLATVKGSITEISVTELAALGHFSESSSAASLPPNTHLVDVREEKEWLESRIPLAKYTGRGLIERRIDGMVTESTDKVILYCGSGARSAFAAETLGKMGYTDVVSLAGGIGAWKAAGFPVSTEPVPNL